MHPFLTSFWVPLNDIGTHDHFEGEKTDITAKQFPPKIFGKNQGQKMGGPSGHYKRIRPVGIETSMNKTEVKETLHKRGTLTERRSGRRRISVHQCTESSEKPLIW